MAVPTWRRHPDDECDYIYNIFTYNTFLGLMVHNGPRKYMNTYGKYIIHAGCSALKYASTANRTRIKDKSSYNFRRNNLLKVFGIIDSLCIVCYIYLSILKNDDNISAKTRKKIARWEKEVGIRTKILSSGKIVMQLVRKNIRDKLRTIKIQKNDLDNGKMPFNSILQSFVTWCSYAGKYNSNKQMLRVGNMFAETFNYPWDDVLYIINKGEIRHV